VRAFGFGHSYVFLVDESGPVFMRKNNAFDGPKKKSRKNFAEWHRRVKNCTGRPRRADERPQKSGKLAAQETDCPPATRTRRAG